jgi:proton glutamate symport protein
VFLAESPCGMRFFWLLLLALGLGTKRHWHILLAIALGAVLGLTLTDVAFAPVYAFFEVVGEIFIRLITMLVIPLVISSLIVGVTSMGDSKQLGRMGGKVLAWFIGLMVFSALLGLGLALLLQPGHGLQATLADATSPLAELASRYHANFHQTVAETPSLTQLLLNLIPINPIESLVRVQLIPVVLFTLLFASAITAIGETGKPLVNFFESVFAATMKLTDWVLMLAVPGLFSLTYVAVAKAGPQVFQLLAPYALMVLAGLLIQLFVVFPLLLKLGAGVSFINLYRAVSEAVMVAFGTASSSATLPVTIACCERRAGISNRIASFVLPTGASINKTGTTLFEVMAVLFLAQAYGLTLTPIQYGLVALFSVFASIGAPGVPSAGLITMAIVINSIGEGFTPMFGGIALLWPIDRFLDMCRTAVNVISSCTVAALVAADEGELNRDVLNSSTSWKDVIQ